MENKLIEAADQAIAVLHDRTDLHTRTIEEARKAARAAIAAYLDRSGLAEARASLERIAVAEGGALHAATIAREALAALSVDTGKPEADDDR